MGRTRIVQVKKLVSFRLTVAQINLLTSSKKALGKSKTVIVEEALAYYLNKLHIEGVI